MTETLTIVLVPLLSGQHLGLTVSSPLLTPQCVTCCVTPRFSCHSPFLPCRELAEVTCLSSL